MSKELPCSSTVTLTIQSDLTPSPNPCIVPYEGCLVIETATQACTLTFDYEMRCSDSLCVMPGTAVSINLNHMRPEFKWTYSIAAGCSGEGDGKFTTGGHTIQIGGSGNTGGTGSH